MGKGNSGGGTPQTTTVTPNPTASLTPQGAAVEYGLGGAILNNLVHQYGTGPLAGVPMAERVPTSATAARSNIPRFEPQAYAAYQQQTAPNPFQGLTQQLMSGNRPPGGGQAPGGNPPPAGQRPPGGYNSNPGPLTGPGGQYTPSPAYGGAPPPPPPPGSSTAAPPSDGGTPQASPNAANANGWTPDQQAYLDQLTRIASYQPTGISPNGQSTGSGPAPLDMATWQALNSGTSWTGAGGFA